MTLRLLHVELGRESSKEPQDPKNYLLLYLGFGFGGTQLILVIAVDMLCNYY